MLPSLNHSVLAISFPPSLPLIETLIPLAPNLMHDCIDLFIALLYEILLTNCWAIFSATKYALVSGFFTSFIFNATSLVVNFDKLKKDLFNFRFQKMNSQVTNPAKIGETKKTIARLKTILKGKINA